MAFLCVLITLDTLALLALIDLKRSISAWLGLARVRSLAGSLISF